MILGTDHLTLREYENIQRLNSMPFEIPDYSSPLYFSKKMIKKDGKLVAAGLMKLTSESILILDKDLPRITRARLLKVLINEMKQILQLQGLDDTHVFLLGEEEKTEKLLSHLEFVPAKGKVMYYHG